MLAFAATQVPEWRSARTGDPNDIGVAILEAVAYEGDVLSYYTDRLANEAFLQTAVQRQSVLNHAALLDYSPRGSSAASVPLAFTVTTTSEPVTIPAGFRVQTARSDQGGGISGGEPGTGSAPDLGGSDDAPISFETTVSLTFPASTTSTAGGVLIPLRQTLYVIAVEGETVEDEVVATLCADPNASYTLARAPVISDSVVIRVVEAPGDAGLVWLRVGNLLDSGPNDNAYLLTLDANDSVIITFGDGVNGRIAPRGSVMHARYRVGGGHAGNVPDGTIVDVVDPDLAVLSPADNPTPIEIVVTNLEPARGGTDSETTESIRSNAPRSRRTSGRAVSMEDYATLALLVPEVQIAKAKAVAKVYTNVTVYVAPPGGGQPSVRMLNAVVEYTLSRKMAGQTVVAATPTYVPVDITLHLFVDGRYNQSSVRQAVDNALQNVLHFENVNFGQEVTLSAVYAAAVGVQGVINAVITKLSRNGASTVSDITIEDNELPLQGTITVTAEGGLVSVVDPLSSSPPPTASGAPVISLLRCDPNSTHVELTWSTGANTTYWEVEAQFKNGATVVATTLTGPFSGPSCSFDLLRIGAGRATDIAFRTRSFNGSVGPVLSALTSTPYLCE